MDFNEAIAALERPRTSDGFADALTIARLCDLAEPTLKVSSNHSLTFETGQLSISDYKSVVVGTTRDLLSSRALIGLLTSMDGGAVLPLTPGVEDQLDQIKNEIWTASSLRGDYGRLLEQDTEIAGLVGIYIGAAQKGIAVIIDGVDAFAAALLAQRIAFRSMDRILAAAPSEDPAIREAQYRLRLPTILATQVSKNADEVALAHLMTTLKLTQ